MHQLHDKSSMYVDYNSAELQIYSDITGSLL